jgi:periplasmic divalent cation tolerance protein
MTTLDDVSHIVVLTTLPDAEAAQAFVRQLVDQRVIACGTVLGRATSVFRWQGAVEEAAEVQVVLKTRRALWDRLEAAVRDAHPYEVPELVALPVAAGSEAYLAWVSAETAA